MSITKKKRAVIAATVVLIGALLLGLWARHQRREIYYGKARREWKDKAVAEVAAKAADAAWIEAERKAVEADDTGFAGQPAPWVSDRMLLMGNGKWIVYRNVCSKQDARIADIFVGKASDGKWYYSTYHFCVGALVLRHGHDIRQPRSLAEFIEKACLREFDGKSDECLQRTWWVE